MVFSAQFLSDIHKKLLAERERLEAELAKIGKPSGKDDTDFQTTWEDYGDKEDENAAEVAAYSDSLGLEATFESELREVVKALLRLDEGTWGICKSCGMDIGEQRLAVRPQAVFCIACQEKAGK